MDYHYNLYLDGLPAAVRIRNPETGELETNYQDGIPVGHFDIEKENLKWILYNHLHMTIYYRKENKNKQIVGFEVEPRAIMFNEMISWEHEMSTPI